MLLQKNMLLCLMFFFLIFFSLSGLSWFFWFAFHAHGSLLWASGFLFYAYDTILQYLMLFLAWGAIRPKTFIPSNLGVVPSLAIIIPCRNEFLVLPACLAALRPQLASGDILLVVDDGSTDNTATWCKENGISLLSKPNSGKADSLNQAIAQVSQTVVITIDADTIVKPGALEAFRLAFCTPNLVAAGGVLEVSTRPSILSRWFNWHQQSEYLRSFLWRAAYTEIDSLLLISGAFAAYRRSALVLIGGFNTNSLVEDYEITHRLHRASIEGNLDWRLGMVSSARAVTDAPATLGLFLAQRSRWFQGFISVHLANRDLVGSWRAKALGMIMLPIKSLDLFMPLVGLLGMFVILVTLVQGRSLPYIVVVVFFAKLVNDVFLALVAVFFMRRWASLHPNQGPRLASILTATAFEPFIYQFVRQSAALLGWIKFLFNNVSWKSQR